MGLQLPTGLMKLQEGSHTGHKHTHTYQAAGQYTVKHTYLITQSCALTSSLHPSQYLGDNETVSVTTPEMHCVTQYPTYAHHPRVGGVRCGS